MRPGPPLFDDFSGEINIYKDCMLHELHLQSRNQVEWTMTWTVLGGQRSIGATTVTVPSVNFQGRTLAWADTTISGLLSTTACQISEMELTLNNAVQQWFGAGQHAACALTGGIFSVRLSFIVRYDDAHAADFEQHYVDGTQVGTMTITIADEGAGAAGTANLTTGAVTSVTITSGGAGYSSPPTVTFTGGGGSGAAGTATISNGAVTGVTITSGGTGYTSAPTVVVSDDTHVISVPEVYLLTCERRAHWAGGDVVLVASRGLFLVGWCLWAGRRAAARPCALGAVGQR